MLKHEIKLIVKQILCIKLVKYWDKYTEMHGQQNVKKIYFMCSVWISEQTAITSLHSTDWLVFITETACVYCAVRNRSSNIIQLILDFKVWTLLCLNRLSVSILHLRIDISKQSHSAQFTSACQHPPLLQLQSAIPYHHNPHYTLQAQSFRSTRALYLHGSAG